MEPPSLAHKLEANFNNLIFQWGLRNPQEAVAACVQEGPHRTFDGWYGLAHLVHVTGLREPLFQAIGKLPDEKQRTKAWASIVGVWGEANPREAAQWLETQPFAKDQNLQWRIIEHWTRRINPQEAADFALRNAEPTSESKDRALMMALPYWSMADPKAASAWLETAGPTDQSMSVVASAMAKKDVPTAIKWAMRISEAQRKSTLGAVMAAAKTAQKDFNPADWSAQTGLSAEELAKLAAEAAQVRMSRF